MIDRYLFFYREQILTNTHSEKEHLAYYVRFVDLLAVCAQVKID